MQLDLFLDSQENTHHDMYTLSMTDKFASTIGAQYFKDKIKIIIIRSKYNIRFGNKIIKIPYESEFYTFRKGYIFRYVLGRVEIQKSYGCTRGYYCFMYHLHNVYQQKKETIEPMWNIFGRDKVYMDKKAIKILLKNYKRKDVSKFVEKF